MVTLINTGFGTRQVLKLEFHFLFQTRITFLQKNIVFFAVHQLRIRFQSDVRCILMASLKFTLKNWQFFWILFPLLFFTTRWSFQSWRRSSLFWSFGRSGESRRHKNIQFSWLWRRRRNWTNLWGSQSRSIERFDYNTKFIYLTRGSIFTFLSTWHTYVLLFKCKLI